jgi:hypothetical protein
MPGRLFVLVEDGAEKANYATAGVFKNSSARIR